ncbi:MAG: hypothetical protein ACYSWO_25390 [Planctomycetota bacterium]|jgi:hypothetical protein
MSQPTTALKRDVTRIFLAVTIGLLAWTSAASAQESLGDAVQMTGCDYLIGKWTGETDDGQTYAIEFKWALKNHVISMHFKGFDFEYHGIIIFDAEKQEVVQIGVDSRGRKSQATWMAEYGEATMKSETKDEYGDVSRMGLVFSNVDAKTMKSKVHGVSEYGELSDEPMGTLEYKRQKK